MGFHLEGRFRGDEIGAGRRPGEQDLGRVRQILIKRREHAPKAIRERLRNASVRFRIVLVEKPLAGNPDQYRIARWRLGRARPGAT